MRSRSDLVARLGSETHGRDRTRKTRISRLDSSSRAAGAEGAPSWPEAESFAGRSGPAARRVDALAAGAGVSRGLRGDATRRSAPATRSRRLRRRPEPPHAPRRGDHPRRAARPSTSRSAGLARVRVSLPRARRAFLSPPPAGRARAPLVAPATRAPRGSTTRTSQRSPRSSPRRRRRSAPSRRRSRPSEPRVARRRTVGRARTRTARRASARTTAGPGGRRARGARGRRGRSSRAPTRRLRAAPLGPRPRARSSPSR